MIRAQELGIRPELVMVTVKVWFKDEQEEAAVLIAHDWQTSYCTTCGGQIKYPSERPAEFASRLKLFLL